jgi:hypothetical protein
MKKRVTNILGLVFVISLLIPMGCKESEKSVEPMDPRGTPKATATAPVVVIPSDPNARPVVMTIINPKALLESTSNSNIEQGSDDLKFISLEAPGNSSFTGKGFKIESDFVTDSKELITVMETDKKAQWHIRIDPGFPDHGKYKVGISQIEFSKGIEISQDDPDYDNKIQQLQSEFTNGEFSYRHEFTNQGSCQIFEKLLISSDGPVATGLVGNPNGSASTCLQSYSIWFELEYRDTSVSPPVTKTRTFRLDPWVIRNP